MSPRRRDKLAALLGSLALASCSELDPEPHRAVAPDSRTTEPEPACRYRDPLRAAWFGDLHVHTALSADAWLFGVRVTPDESYRYAFGGAVRLPPNDTQGRGTREVHIDRPLDFAAVTDHAEFLGEMNLCLDPGSDVYDGDYCEELRAGSGRSTQLAKHIFSPITWRADAVCGGDGLRCARASESGWREIVDAAEAWDDRSAGCRRTTFVAYEYSSHRLGSNLHRNVIFRNAVVPRRPISYIEAPREWTLWRLLKQTCIESGTGCDVLAIPHNSNISNGRMFAVDYPGTGSIRAQRARASLRAELEPIVEIMQHKGDSECRNGVDGVLQSADELCDFEKFENLAFSHQPFGADVSECYDGPLADAVPHLGPDCISHRSYVRYALTEGLAEEARLGVNPFKLGLSASTDTHNGLAGGVEERSYAGHLGEGDDSPLERVAYDREIPGNASNGPGGLIGIWAEENSREALFEAMRRREVFGTSGPRIQPRFFGAWDLDDGLCDDPGWISAAYRDGVPMGGDLPARAQVAGDGAPAFIAMAHRDPGTREAPGGLLQRIQIIKGWIDGEGRPHQQIYDVAGEADNGASVDLDTCEPRGPGFARLCTVWRDPDFEPERRAVYYARVVENPSCRYSTWQCLGLPENERPDDCAAPEVPTTLQERAWTSPIWYTPAAR